MTLIIRNAMALIITVGFDFKNAMALIITVCDLNNEILNSNE